MVGGIVVTRYTNTVGEDVGLRVGGLVGEDAVGEVGEVGDVGCVGEVGEVGDGCVGDRKSVV